MNNSNYTIYRCDLSPLIFEIPRYVHYIQGVLILLVALGSFALNGFTVFLIIWHKRLHQRAFYLALQICIINLIFTLFIHTTGFISSFTNGWLLGDIGCQVVGFVQDTLSSVRFLFALLLGVERLMTVFCPFWYNRNGSKTALGMVIALWVFSIIRGIIPLSGLLDCYVYVPTFKCCILVFRCSDQCYAFGAVTVTSVYVAGTFLPFFLYIILFAKARQVYNQLMGANSSDRQWYEHNWRAIITFIILFIALIGCSLPPIIISLVFQIELAVAGHPSTVIIHSQMFVGRTMFLLLTAIDPFVILRNRDVRECLKRRKTRYHTSQRPSARSIVIGSDGGHGISENTTRLWYCHLISYVYENDSHNNFVTASGYHHTFIPTSMLIAISLQWTLNPCTYAITLRMIMITMHGDNNSNHMFVLMPEARMQGALVAIVQAPVHAGMP